MRRLASSLLALAVGAVATIARQVHADDTSLSAAPGVPPGAVPSTRPAPGFAAKQRLTDEDYARKVDGSYVTGLPLFAYDPNFGFGAGARAYYYYNGHPDDPLFAYTPYLHRVYGQAFATTGGGQDHVIDYDAPAFPDADYRVRATLEFEADTDWPYFGVGSRSMAPLSYAGAPGVTFARMSDYTRATTAVQPDGTTYARYNVYGFHRPVLQLALERNLLGGLLRSMVGVNIFSGSLFRSTRATSSRTPTPECTRSSRANSVPKPSPRNTSTCA
jgi:hypothetical protein